MLYAVSISIRKLASLIGNIVAIFPLATFCPLHFRCVEKNKKENLEYYNKKYEKRINISDKVKHEILWWINNIDTAYHHIIKTNLDIITYTDACLSGKGITDGNNSSRELWKMDEVAHINILELKAIEIDIRPYCKNRDLKHVTVMCDNTATITYNS